MVNHKNFQVDIIGVQNIHAIKKGDDISEIILLATKLQDTPIAKQDVIVVTQKIVSKSKTPLPKNKNKNNNNANIKYA